MRKLSTAPIQSQRTPLLSSQARKLSPSTGRMFILAANRSSLAVPFNQGSPTSRPQASQANPLRRAIASSIIAQKSRTKHPPVSPSPRAAGAGHKKDKADGELSVGSPFSVSAIPLQTSSGGDRSSPLSTLGIPVGVSRSPPPSMFSSPERPLVSSRTLPFKVHPGPTSLVAPQQRLGRS
ncbi:hypothetical protein PMIN01_07605 [Paraphaeosphaeria minitans]|uniref:Uncharacterized protein n=1 Tax=Paraphaeosphaeria minitans TaxID=565426 RepID=A0A9P6GF95_9PLEO|nr:hypothetical protein PMIN01_07605 [Paraphaeosphaeria minitans]